MYEDIEEFISTCGLFQTCQYPNGYINGQGIPTNFLFQKKDGSEHLDRARFQKDGIYLLPFDGSPSRVTILLQDIVVFDKNGNEFIFTKGSLTVDYVVDKNMLKLQRGISCEYLFQHGVCDSPETEEEGYLPIFRHKSACD